MMSALKALAAAKEAGIEVEGEELVLRGQDLFNEVADALIASKPDLMRVHRGREAARAIFMSEPPPGCWPHYWASARRSVLAFIQEGWGDQAAIVGWTIDELYKTARLGTPRSHRRSAFDRRAEGDCDHRSPHYNQRVTRNGAKITPCRKGAFAVTESERNLLFDPFGVSRGIGINSARTLQSAVGDGGRTAPRGYADIAPSRFVRIEGDGYLTIDAAWIVPICCARSPSRAGCWNPPRAKVT